MATSRAPLFHWYFIVFFIICLLAGPLVAFGQGAKQPDEATDGAAPPDVPVEAVYDATLALPTIEDILARTEAELSAIRQVELTVELEQYNATDGSVTPGRGKLTAVLPDLFRFDWLQPDMMAGSILMVDRARNEAHQYNPIREEIIVQRWDRLAAQQNLVPDIDRWLALPDPEDYDISFGGVEYVDDRALYVVLARPSVAPEQLYEFYVDPESWMVDEFRYFDGEGRLALRGVLKDVRINGDVTENRIRELPRARIRHL